MSTLIAREKAAVVSAQIVALVVSANGPGLQFGYADADRLLEPIGPSFVSVDEAALHDDEEEGRQLLQDEILVGHLCGLLLFGERVDYDDFLQALAD